MAALHCHACINRAIVFHPSSLSLYVDITITLFDKPTSPSHSGTSINQHLCKCLINRALNSIFLLVTLYVKIAITLYASMPCTKYITAVPPINQHPPLQVPRCFINRALYSISLLLTLYLYVKIVITLYTSIATCRSTKCNTAVPLINQHAPVEVLPCSINRALCPISLPLALYLNIAILLQANIAIS